MTRDRARRAFLLVLAVALAVVSPWTTASWNDGSRLAAVESLGDHATWAIDHSIFVDPSRAEASAPSPYAVRDGELVVGTGDKMLIGGHYYSDKSPVPSLLMAGLYKALRQTTGLKAQSRPDLFIATMTIATSGIAYVVAVAAMHGLALRVFARPDRAFAVAASFALATAAPAFTRSVNMHIVLLAVAAALFLALEEFRRRLAAEQHPWLLAAAIGTLAGFGYGTDLGTGFALVATLVPLLAYRCRALGSSGVKLFGVFLIAALPWGLLHHTLNYRIGGSLLPVGANPAHFDWPGSPWVGQAGAPPREELTGRWKHPGLLAAAVYASKFLVGTKGLLLLNPVMLLAVPAWVVLLRRKPRLPETPELIFGAAWGLATWLLYSALSTDKDWSFRWLLPLLAPGYYAIAILLRERPRLWREFLMLTAGGLVIAVEMWKLGPFAGVIPGFRTVLWTLLFVWLALQLIPRLDGHRHVPS